MDGLAGPSEETDRMTLWNDPWFMPSLALSRPALLVNDSSGSLAFTPHGLRIPEREEKSSCS